MTTQHTPGPWHVTYGNGTVHLATVRGLGTLATFTNPVNQADAMLVAAAPELLEALEITLEQLSGTLPRVDAIMQAAIKKAKGA